MRVFINGVFSGVGLRVFFEKVITYYQSCSTVPSAFCSSASSVSIPSIIPNSFSRQIPVCNFCCRTSCRLCHRFGESDSNSSTLLQPPFFLNPFYTGPALPESHFTNTVAPLALNRFVEGNSIPDFIDEEFHEIHPTLYPGTELQLLNQNPQHLPPEQNHLPYILVANQEEILGESSISKHNPEGLQLVLLNPFGSTSSSPQSSNTLPGFGHLLSTVPSNVELVQMVM
ncbi:hypothetical protein PGB90_002350 [Kerria lacca]